MNLQEEGTAINNLYNNFKDRDLISDNIVNYVPDIKISLKEMIASLCKQWDECVNLEVQDNGSLTVSKTVDDGSNPSTSANVFQEV